MDSRNGRNSRSERRASAQRAARLSLLDHDLSDDDYDLNEMTVANGFRPNGDSSSSMGTPPLSHFPARNNTTVVPKRHSSHSQRPSTISKPNRQHDSLALQNDGADSRISRPSHPYQLYNQGMTNDAISPSGNGPTHPYTLYTQNTANVESPRDSQIPVGFHGLGGSYTRQIGPDGEETGGLLGPMGHTEELPPYSRYPELEYSSRDVTTARVSDADDSNTPPSAIDGAGGIGLATRNPEFSATEESLRRPRSQRSDRSRVSEDSVHGINVGAMPLSEKPVMTKWQRRARKKLWGIVPYWAICLMTVGMAIMGIVCGAVIGTLLHKNHQLEDNDNELKLKPSSGPKGIEFLDVFPPNLPSMPVGTFQLPHMDVSQAPRSCIHDTSQSNAWTCKMSYRYDQLDVERIPGESNVCDYNLRLEAINPSNSMFIYGTKPPNVPPGSRLKLVNDTFETGRGPAWWLQVPYNKTVFVREEDFPGGKSSHSNKRGWPYDFGIFAETYKSPSSIAAQEGDMPWICTWPETTLDIFIYPSQNTSRGSSGNSHSGSTSTSTSDASSPSETALPFIPPPPFPKVVKFLERRLSDKLAPAATCKQYEIVNGGYRKNPVCDKYGNPIVISIKENMDDWAKSMAQFQSTRYRPGKRESEVSTPVPRALEERGLELTNCGCLWFSFT